MDVNLYQAAIRPLVHQVTALTFTLTRASDYCTGQKACAGQSRNAYGKLTLQGRHIPSPVIRSGCYPET